MYNIHSHYYNLFSFLQTIIAQPRLEYLHPFGSSSLKNIEALDTNDSLDQDPIVFCYDQEPLIPKYNDELFQRMSALSNRFNRPFILVTTEQDSDALNYFVKKYKVIPCYGFFHIFAAHDWFRGYQYDCRIIPTSQRKLKKKFITFNRLTGSSRIYRSLFVGELAKKNLINQGHVSYSHVCPEHGHYHQNLDQSLDTYKLNSEYVNSIKQVLDQLSHPMRIDHIEKDSIPNHSMILSAVPECMESFLYIVTETCFWEKKKHLTEKIFKPIILRMPFVLVGCAHNLQYLKSYGFQTFDRWIDESYDCIENPVLRLQAIVKVVEYLASLTLEDLTDMLNEMEPVLIHNYNLFNSQDFLDLAWEELKSNLTLAVNSVPM